ncbi:glycosyltransferase family 2 protein [Geobacter sp. AOG2]|uniref:glycosyltransferase family 2 protein n=1 Tax=Geobacter sp. AOG2 TaxID=1566347 RepID=UPI001CC49011|nr:glycosyltransferase family 2 protein [Geobacter sp. AOG2]GFE61331.1 glycosyl transferase [Geobacter sp. AOG2]
MPLVYIIIVNWNGLADTVECLESLRSIDYSNYRVVVVDNASSDNTVEVIKLKYPDVFLIINSENLGFARANNRAISFALSHKADFIFLLNNDTIVKPDIVSRLLQAHSVLTNPGLLGCKIYYYDEPETIQYCGGILEYFPELKGYHGEEGCIDDGGYDDITVTDFVTGCAMFGSRQLWENIEGFDENFFMYWEDSELSLRVRNMGSFNYVIPSAILYHKVGSSTGRRDHPLNWFYWSRNRIYFAKKHNIPFPAFRFALCRLRTVLGMKWPLRYTGALSESLAYLYGALTIMGRAPRFLERSHDSFLEARVRKKFGKT